MKNLKNMLVVSGLMVVFMIGATTANAGIIIIAKDNQESAQTVATQCTQDDTTFFQKIGIVLTDWAGLLVTDAIKADTNCNADDSETNGLLVSD